MDIILTQYSLISNIFHYLNHSDLLAFGSCSRTTFVSAKDELNRKYPCPIWEINDYLISLSPSSKPKKFHKDTYFHNQDFFCMRKGIHVYYKSQKNKVYFYVYSIYGNYLKILIHHNDDQLDDGNCQMDEVNSQHIFHFNNFEKTLVFFDSPLFPSSLVDLSQTNTPIIRRLVFNNIVQIRNNFAHVCQNFGYYQDTTTPVCDFLYKELEICKICFFSKFVPTHASSFNYVACDHSIYQLEEHKLKNVFNSRNQNFLAESCIIEDKYYISNNYLAPNYFNYNIFDLHFEGTLQIALQGQYCYIGNSCLASLSEDENKLKLLDLRTMKLLKSDKIFDGQPIGSVDGKYGLFLRNNTEIFRIENIKDKLSFTVINK